MIFDIITIMPFGCFLYTFRAKSEGKHLKKLCAYLSIKFQVMYA